MDASSESETEINCGRQVKTPRCLEENVDLIDCIEEGKNISSFIKETCSEISVIAEGSNLGPYGELSLLAIGGAGRIFVIDVLTCPQLMQKTSFKKVLEGKRILKVMYDSRNVSAVLYGNYRNTLITPIFDIQCANAYIESQHTQCTPFEIPSLSLLHLCHKYSKNNVFCSYLTSVSERVERINWWNRPLNKFALKAIAAKVLCFFPDVYNNMKMLIHPLNLETFFKICNMNVIYHIFPETYERERNEILCRLYNSSSVVSTNAGVESIQKVPNTSSTKQMNQVMVTNKRKSCEEISSSPGRKKSKICPTQITTPRKLTMKQHYKLQSDTISEWNEENKMRKLQTKLCAKPKDKIICTKDKVCSEDKTKSTGNAKSTQEWQTISPDFMDVLLSSEEPKKRQGNRCSEQCKSSKRECTCQKCKKR